MQAEFSLSPHRFFTSLGYVQTPTRTMYVEYVGSTPISHLLVSRAHVARNTNCLHLHTTCMAMEDLQRTGVILVGFLFPCLPAPTQQGYLQWRNRWGFPPHTMVAHQAPPAYRSQHGDCRISHYRLVVPTQ